MRKTLGVCLLTLLLTCSTSAGIMQNGSPTPPPPPPPAEQEAAAAATAEDGTQGTFQGGVTRVALDLLALLPSLL